MKQALGLFGCTKRNVILSERREPKNLCIDLLFGSNKVRRSIDALTLAQDDSFLDIKVFSVFSDDSKIRDKRGVGSGVFLGETFQVVQEHPTEHTIVLFLCDGPV